MSRLENNMHHPFGFEAYEKYVQWSTFTSEYPYNTELLIELFGERDAMDIFMLMIKLPESKAREIVIRLRQKVKINGKLQNMSHS